MSVGALLLSLLLSRAAVQDPPAPAQDPLSFDLELKEVPTQEVFRQIGLRTGCWTSFEGNADFRKPLTVAFRKIDYWRAIDEIRRLHGNLRHSPASDWHWRLVPGPWTPEPVSYAGAFRFSVAHAVRVRELKSGERRDRTELVIRRQPVPGLPRSWDPSGRQGTLDIDRAEDGAGRSLLPAPELADPLGFSGYGQNDWTVLLRPVPTGEKVLGRVDGTWRGVLLDEIETVVFDDPANAVGTSKAFGPLSVTLRTCRSAAPEGDSKYWTVELELKADLSLLPEAERKPYLDVPLLRRLLDEFSGGKTGAFLSYRYDPDPLDPCRATMTAAVSSRPELIRCRIAKRAQRVAVPFSFSGIPLPADAP